LGRKHDNFRLPLVLAGGLGGTPRKRGVLLNYLDASEEQPQDVQLIFVAHGSFLE